MFQKIIKHLSRNLSQQGIAAKITGRIKHPISILYKLYRKGITVEQLTDVFAISIMVPKNWTTKMIE